MEQRVAQPGDRICNACGEPNDPSRKFCRRCGASLLEAKVVAAPRLPWWKRLFGRSKPDKQYAAGERKASMQKAAPKSGGLGGILKSVGVVRGLLALVVGIGIFGYIGIPSFQGIVNNLADPIMHGGPTQVVENIRKLIAPKALKVNPIKETVTGSSGVKNHGPGLVFDNATNTDWQATDNVPELKVPLQESVDLSSVIVHSGNAAAFTDFRRPAVLEFVLPDGSTQQINLEDVHDPQTFDLKGSGVDELTIRIVKTYGPPDKPISLSELELFKKG